MAFINGHKILSVVKTEFLPAVYQTKTITPQNQTREITADAGYAGLDKVILDGTLIDPHQSYTSQTDSTAAYQKTVPNNALLWAGVNYIGNMSYKAVNLFDKSTALIGYQIDGNGNIFADANYMLSDYIEVKPATLYSFYVSNIAFLTCFFDENKTIISGTAYTASFTTTATTKYIRFTALKTRLDAFMLVKGTNVPTTYVEYVGNFDGIRDSAVTSVVSKDSNNDTLDTLTIAAEVQALEGYGWGVNDTCYNYIDYEAKKFIQKVGRVKAKDLTFNTTSVSNMFAASDLNSVIKIVANNETANLLCNVLTTTTANSVYGKSTTNIIGVVNNGGIWVYINDNITTTQELYNYFNDNDYIYYELATPIETDISSYLDAENIKVAASGNLTFTNTYEQSVPSEIVYLVEV